MRLIAPLFGAVAALAAPHALAQTTGDIAKTALTNAWIRIDGFYHLHPDCSHVGYPTVRVTSGPSAGRVSIRREKGFPGFDADSTRAKCNAQRVNTTAIYYRSNRRFVGADSFTLELFWTDGDHWTRKVTVDVR